MYFSFKKSITIEHTLNRTFISPSSLEMRFRSVPVAERLSCKILFAVLYALIPSKKEFYDWIGGGLLKYEIFMIKKLENNYCKD